MTQEVCVACSGLLSVKEDHFVCNQCGSVYFPARKNFSYDKTYHEVRGHFETAVKKCKKKTYERFLTKLAISMNEDSRVLEVGFGAGVFLEYLREKNIAGFGLEPDKEVISMMAARGFAKDRLTTSVNAFVQKNLKFQNLFYFDSFEHLFEPESHLSEINLVTTKGARALLVLPRADSLSRFILRGAWPHDLPDHWVFYSKKGLIEIWKKNGWNLVSSFYPAKMINAEMVVHHLGLKLSLPLLKILRKMPSFWFNFGEMGVIFEKN